MRAMLLTLSSLVSLADGSKAQPAAAPEQLLATGPGRICLLHTSVDLVAHETAWLDYVGIHSRGIHVTTLAGTFSLREGTWVAPRTRGRAVRDSRGRHIVRYGGRRHLRYLIFARSEAPETGDWPSVWVEGGALDGTAHDRAILARIDVEAFDPSRCARRIGAD